MIKVHCINCNWWDEYTPTEVPLRCPECSGVVERATNPEVPDNTKSDKI